MKKSVIFRADGNANIGFGHVIRSLALAEMLSDQFDLQFITKSVLPEIKILILEICNKIIELPAELNLVDEAEFISTNYLNGSEILILDGYNYDTEYQIKIKEKKSKLVCIDDIHSYHFVSDVIINHSGGIIKSNYSAETYTNFFLGPEYALLRKPFRKAAKNKSMINKMESVFICFGGSDPGDHTLKVLKECVNKQFFKKYYIVIGGAYKHEKKLGDFVENNELNVRLLKGVSAIEMVRTMKKCGVAITPPSSISMEYLSVGGILFLLVTANNQNNIYNYYIKNNLALDFKDLKKINKHMSSAGIEKKNIFDGMQKKRLLKIFNSIK